MTANQIAYQANKLRESELAVKQQEADTKSRRADMQNKLDYSTHISEYGYVKGPKDQSFLGGQKVWKDMSEVSKNIFGGASNIVKAMR